MSENTESSLWSTEEGDLDNIDKQVQLVSMSSGSNTQSPTSQSKNDCLKSKENSNKVDAVAEKDENEKMTELTRQSSIKCEDEKIAVDSPNSSVDLQKSKMHSSCNDLLSLPVESRFDIKFPKRCSLPGEIQNKKNNFKRSTSCISLNNGVKIHRGKYDHVQSKVKQYFNNNNNSVKKETPLKNLKNSNYEMKEDEGEEKEQNSDSFKKEEYLEEINKRLTKELDEKSALLSKLQENYEQLLFKYAEAQNRIDQLRFKFINGSSECTSRSGFKPRSSRTSIRIPLHSLYNSNDFSDSKEDGQDVKCQKAIVTPFMKTNNNNNNNNSSNNNNDACENKSDCDIGTVPINRPSSLPIDSNIRNIDRDALKAATPTDSEGVSSVITSMSGHSKILNTLDEESESDKKLKMLEYQNSEFILENNSDVNDSFDKVKNWQNSLPPLELIETPDTILYDAPPSCDVEPDVSPSTNYDEIPPSPKMNQANSRVEEMFPSCWREKESNFQQSRGDYQKSKMLSQAVMKKYLRTLSLPSSLTKRNLMSMIYKRKNHHTIDLCAPSRADFNGDDGKTYIQNNEANSAKTMQKNDVPSSCIIQRRRKKPPLLRCSSLPAYDYDSPKSGSYRNGGVYIPPLDLDNLTLSDDESSPRLDYDTSKSNINISPSFGTSRGNSMDCSFQTLHSINSCKAVISEYSSRSFSRPRRPVFHKSTSITPDRSQNMIFPPAIKERVGYLNSEPVSKESLKKVCSPDCNMYKYNGKSRIDSKDWCNVCGETITNRAPILNFPCRSNSYQSVQEIKDTVAKSSIKRTKYPFNRSVSFNSETNSPSFCFHDDKDPSSPRNSQNRLSQDSLEKFDMYTNNLKARSQAVIKALTAHVNNS